MRKKKSVLAPITASFTANGFTGEYTMNGENTNRRIIMNPAGPRRYLFQGVPKGLILIISASHLD